MRGILKRVTAPPTIPVSVAEAKARLKIDDSDHDEDLERMIREVVDHLDGESGILNRCLVAQTWDYVLPGFCERIVLPLAPFRSITSITYLDPDGVSQTLDSGNYRVIERGDDAFSELRAPRDGDWPDTVGDEPEAVTIRAVFGYAPSNDSPPNYTENISPAIKSAIIAQVGAIKKKPEEIMRDGWKWDDSTWRMLRPKRLSWL
jgi:uncharacterized phiE125 gp8 family phage protein